MENREKIIRYRKEWDIKIIIKCAICVFCMLLTIIISSFNDLIYIVLGKTLFFVLYFVGIIAWTIFLILNFKIEINQADIVFLVVGDGKRNKEFNEVFPILESKDELENKEINDWYKTRAERRKKESLLSLKMLNATLELSIVCANALAGGHNNGNVEEARIAAKNARDEYEKFVIEMAAEERVPN